MTPLPRDPGVQRAREFLYPYRVLDTDGRALALSAATLAELADHYSWNFSDHPATLVVYSVQSRCGHENDWARKHLIRLLAAGTLGVAPRQVGDDIFWHEGYVAMHDGYPEPEPNLADFYAFWTGDDPDDLGGVCAESGLLCWWEAKVGPGWARETSYFLQEFSDFLRDGPPERVLHMWIDRDVEADLRPLVAARAG